MSFWKSLTYYITSQDQQSLFTLEKTRMVLKCINPNIIYFLEIKEVVSLYNIEKKPSRVTNYYMQ